MLAKYQPVVRIRHAGTVLRMVVCRTKEAISVHDVIDEIRSSVRGLFRKHLMCTGAIERMRAKQLAASMDDRMVAGYDAAAFFSAAEARRECRSARALVGRIPQYLVTHGFTDDELTTEARSG